MIYFAIVDDDPVYVVELQAYCKKLLEKYVYEMRVYSSYEALKKDKKYLKEVDVLISDIELEEENGISEAKKLKEEYPNICILFISSYIKYAPMVYDVDHLYFVLKDQLRLRLAKALQAALRFVDSQKNDMLTIKWKGQFDVVPVKDILMIERQNRKTRIVTKEKDYFTYVPFQEIVDELSQDDFIRIHFSYLVQLRYVKHFERDHVILKNEEYVPISRTYEKKAKDLFLKYLSSEVFF